MQLGRLCGLVVRVLGYRPGGPDSIPGTTKKKATQPREYNWEAVAVLKTENTAVGIRHADHVAPFIRKIWQSLRRQVAVARSV
jgi:hypothetical protein